MDIIKTLLKTRLLNVELKLKISKKNFYKNIVPEIKKISKYNNIPIKISEQLIYSINDEIIFYLNYPYLKLICNHEYYDGVRLSKLCEQFNKKNEVIKKIFLKDNYIYGSIKSVITNKLYYNNTFGISKTKKITEFSHPIRTQTIISYIQNIEKNVKIMLLKKNKNTNEGNNFGALIINPNQSLVDAIESNNYLNLQNGLINVFNKKKIINLNLYHKFILPYFVEKMVIAETYSKNIIDLIFPFITNYTLTPKNSNNKYELYLTTS